MLTFVDKIKVDKDCCAVLVGGDFNLKSSIAKEVLLPYWPGKPENADLLNYVIAWPSNRITQKSRRVIDTVPASLKQECFTML